MALTKQQSQWREWIEGGALLFAAPFLLFPTISVTGTLFAFLIIIAVWLFPVLTKQRPFLPSTPFNGIFLLWSFMVIVGIGVTADPDLTLPKASGLFLGFALWRYMVWTIHDTRRLTWGVFGFALLALGFTLFGALGIDWTNKIPFLATVIARLPSSVIQIPESSPTGISANQLAGTIEIPMIVCLSFLIGWRPQRQIFPIKIGLFLLFAGLAGLLVLTQSRSGWMGGIGGLLALLTLWAIAMPRSKKRAMIWLVLAFFIVLGVLGAIQIGPEKLQNLWEDPAQDTAIGNLGTIEFRKEVWQWALTGIEDFSFTGMGIGSFRRVVKRLYPINVAFDYDIAHAHNIFLQVALDLGLPGLIAYLALLMVAAFVGWRVAWQNERLRPLALGLLAGLAALHIYDMADAIAPGSKPGLLFWASLGLLAAMHQITIKNSDNQKLDSQQ